MYTSVAHKTNRLDLTDLSDIRLEPPEDGAEHTGLYTTYQTARKILLNPKILQILSKTFAPCEKDSGIGNYITKIVEKGFHIYIMEWEDSTCAFHQLPHNDTNGSIDLENISYRQRKSTCCPKRARQRIGLRHISVNSYFLYGICYMKCVTQLVIYIHFIIESLINSNCNRFRHYSVS